MDALDVYLNDQRVGRLSKEDALLSFRYDETYLNTAHPLPLSRHLPIASEQPSQIFGDQASRAFFENLLPEGNVRSQVARSLGISRENTFALLAALGGDCAGAVSLLPPGEEPSGRGHYRPISEIDLAEELHGSSGGSSSVTLLVDEVVGPEEVVVRPLPHTLEATPLLLWGHALRDGANRPLP